MRNIRIDIEYDGTEYSGWQYQPDKRTIQGTIEKALKRISEEDIRITGAGRTDAGVHALTQVANFRMDKDIPVENLQKALNNFLPRDIFIKRTMEVPMDFNARYDAKSRVYEYRIVLEKSPLRRRYAWELSYRLDYKRMEEAKKIFIGKKDYGFFCELQEPSIVDVRGIRLTKQGNEIIVKIEANRFLYKMVRRIVGALVDVGRGKIEVEDILKSFGRTPNPFITAPANGLMLVKVKY